jgi:hypothetical protein
MGDSNGMMGLLTGGLGCVLEIVLYCYFAFATMTIAKKTGTPNEWMAWVPIANLVLLVQMAQKETWWVVLFFIPIANIVVSILCYNAIAVRLGKPEWIGWLTLVPCVGFVVPGYLAWG